MDDWAKIVAEHGPWAWQVAYRLLGSEADASDSLQDAFVAAVEISRRQAVRSWPALLRRLVTNRALDRLRERCRRRQHTDGSIDLSAIAERASGPLDEAQAHELSDALRNALAGLPAQQAAVFTMRFLDDLTYEQIAEVLDLQANHVGVLLGRARVALREKLNCREECRGPR